MSSSDKSIPRGGSQKTTTPGRLSDTTQSKTPVHRRLIKFNPQTTETSFGGSQTIGQVKNSSLLETSVLSNSNNLNVTVKVKTRSSRSPQKIFTPLRKSDGFLKESNPSTPANQKISSFNQRRVTDGYRVHGGGTPECFNSVLYETPKPTPVKKRVSAEDGDIFDGSSSGVTVAVRVRPFNSRELAETETQCAVTMTGTETVVTTDRGETHRFNYDYSFWSFDNRLGHFADQKFVYESLAQPILSKAFEGYNTCLFAYGQTGSGKSYSITGEDTEEGIIPRFCEELFLRIADHKGSVTAEISYFEIYNEKIHDLLAPGSIAAQRKEQAKKATLKVREHPELGPYVEGLTTHGVQSFEHIKGWLSVGNKHRATAATGMNDKSSRSHSVFTLLLTQTQTDSFEGDIQSHSTSSKINIVDLAGSERQSLAKTCGDRLRVSGIHIPQLIKYREGASINKSLMVLGKVISLLSERSVSANKRKKLFVPYRDSVLTWLLRESLGGNSKTAMLATISPARSHVEETLSTLRYAQQARSIINIARVNEDPNARLIRDLRQEIESLRQQAGGGDSLSTITKLKQQLLDKEEQMKTMARKWQDQLKASEEKRREESILLERSGITVQQVDRHLPYLVNLNEDPQLSELLLYTVQSGVTRVGHTNSTQELEIRLNGALITDHHCEFSNDGSHISLTPSPDAQTFVNGVLIQDKTSLHHGDRVVLGGNHYFRLNHPGDLQKGRRSDGGQVKDFTFAHNELLAVQNKKLEEARLQMEDEVTRTREEASREINLQKLTYEEQLQKLNHKLSVTEQKKAAAVEQCQEYEEELGKLNEKQELLQDELTIVSRRKKIDLPEPEPIKWEPFKSTLLERMQVMQQTFEKSSENELQNIAKILPPPATIPRPDKVSSTGTKLAPTARHISNTGTKLGQNSARTKHRTVDRCRLALMLREANKISRSVGANTELVQMDVPAGDEPLIKVTNTKLGVSAAWSLPVFEDRLLQMRELHQSDGWTSRADVEQVFFSSKDIWDQAEKVQNYDGLSPRIVHSIRSQSLSCSPLPVLTFNSPGSTIAGRKHSVAESDELTAAPNLSRFCRDLINSSLSVHADSSRHEGLSQRLLSHSQTLLTSLQSCSTDADQHNDFLTRDDSQDHLVSLTTHTQLLLATSAMWVSSMATATTVTTQQAVEQLEEIVIKFARAITVFLQGCETGMRSLRQESVTSALEYNQQLNAIAQKLTSLT